MIPSLNEQQTREYLSRAGYAPLATDDRSKFLKNSVLYVIDEVFKTAEHYGRLDAFPSFANIATPISLLLNDNDQWVLCYHGMATYWAVMQDGSCLRVKNSSKPEVAERFVTPANVLIRQR